MGEEFEESDIGGNGSRHSLIPVLLVILALLIGGFFLALPLLEQQGRPGSRKREDGVEAVTGGAAAIGTAEAAGETESESETEAERTEAPKIRAMLEESAGDAAQAAGAAGSAETETES